MIFLIESLRSRLSAERGEDVAEYALVLGLVAIAAIVGITLVGSSLQGWWNSLGGYISGLPTP